MKRIFLLLLLGCCVVSSNLFAQTGKEWPKSLLWKISGNGLPKESFLYGTMHVQDKRLFYFSDSLYHFLEKAEGYSMEVDIREFMDSIIKRSMEENRTEREENKKKLTKSEEKKMVDSLMQSFKKYKDKKSRKQLEKLRRQRMEKAMKNKEMPTIMDVYLYGIAKRQGKWVGGIEDVQDQLPILNEFGKDISDDDFSMSDILMSLMLDSMTKIYLNKDLNAIERFMGKNYSKKLEDMLFLKRNIKMARRMDSLAHVRSMFFAVGAAHLPGDSGVINLLKRKGYNVEPVFSSKTLDPFAYASTLGEMPWIKVEDESKSYSIQMPGEPTDMNMEGDFIKMKFYMDVTTYSCFMVGNAIGQGKVNLERMSESIESNSEADVISKKMIEQDGMKGMEVVFTSGDFFFKARYLVHENNLYVLMVGGQKKEDAGSKDAEKFLRSFAANKTRPAPAPKQWKAFELKDKAMTVMMPGKPVRNAKIEESAAGTGWDFLVYHYSDADAGIYYMLQVRDIKPAFYLENDTAYFSEMRDNMKQGALTVNTENLYKMGEFPAYRYEGNSEDGGIIYKTLVINRGNRSYVLYTGGANTEAAIRDMESFLGSLVLSEYEKPAWKNERVAGANFSTASPVPIIIKEEKKGEEEEAETDEKDLPSYIAFDPIDCISYEVYKTPHTPYFWITDDSAYFDGMISNHKAWGDSVWSRKEVTNGKLKGIEWVIETPGTSNMKRVRQFLNGDTLYTLSGIIPVWDINDKEKARFFEEFRIINETVPVSIYQSKAEKVLTDLQSSDSTTFADASVGFSNAVFSKKELPLLHEALLKKYNDDDSLYYDIRTRITEEVSSLADSSTVDFIKKNYNSLPADKEFIKVDLLDVLARYRNIYSYTVLKDLLINHTPAKIAKRELTYRVIDSMLLTRTLYPEILQLSNNALFAERLMDITVDLLDSNIISKDMIMPYRKNFLHSADTILADLKKRIAGEEDYYAGSRVYVVKLLQYFNDAESNALLQQYLGLSDMLLKYQSAVTLLKNDQTVDKKEIEKIAADNEYRIDLHTALTEMGKQKLFPSKYLTQQYFAESVLFLYAYDEAAPKEIVFLESKTAMYKGEKKRFYLFKIVYDYSEDEDNKGEYMYLGFAGPYSTDKKIVETNNDVTGIRFSDNYDAKLVDEWFAERLKEMEEAPVDE